MDLNNIELPASLVAGLYRSSLIETDDTNTNMQPIPPVENEKTGVIEKPSAGGRKWLGENKKNILVVVRSTEAVYLPDAELNFLTGILGACKLGLADVAVININGQAPESYREPIGFFKSAIVFLFGVEPADFGLPIQFPHFQVQAFHQCSFLFTPSLDELEKDKLLKSKLWVCLRRLFNI